AAGVERIDEDAAEVHAVAVDGVVVAQRRADRGRVRVVELEPDVQEAVVVREIGDALHRRLGVVARVHLEPGGDRRGAAPPLVREVAVDVNGAGGARDPERRPGEGRLRGGWRGLIDGRRRQDTDAEPPHVVVTLRRYHGRGS